MYLIHTNLRDSDPKQLWVLLEMLLKLELFYFFQTVHFLNLNHFSFTIFITLQYKPLNQKRKRKTNVSLLFIFHANKTRQKENSWYIWFCVFQTNRRMSIPDFGVFWGCFVICLSTSLVLKFNPQIYSKSLNQRLHLFAIKIQRKKRSIFWFSSLSLPQIWLCSMSIIRS